MPRQYHYQYLVIKIWISLFFLGRKFELCFSLLEYGLHLPKNLTQDSVRVLF